MINICNIFKRVDGSVCKTGHTSIRNGYHGNGNTDISTTNQYVIESSECRKLSHYNSITRGERFSFFRDWNDKRNQDEQTRRNKIESHCDILLSNFITFNKAYYSDRTLQRYLSGFRYWDNIRQHFETGHDEIFKHLMKVLNTDETLDELNNKKNKEFIAYEYELKKLFNGYNIKTRTLGGACNGCLQYHDNRTRKKYEKVLHPEND